MLITHPVKGTIWLTDEEKQDPRIVLQEFFENYRLHEARQDVADCMRVCLITDNSTFDTGQKRSNALFLYEQVNRLLEACYLITHK